MPLPRKHDWELHLHEYELSKRGLPFRWGDNDCALFVCDGIHALTGVDVGGEFRGKYSSLASAIVTIREVTGGTSVENVAEHIASQYGLAELPTVKYAQRGDAVLFDGAEGPALGLVYFNGTHAMFVGPEGLRRVPVKSCRRAWRIG